MASSTGPQQLHAAVLAVPLEVWLPAVDDNPHGPNVTATLATRPPFGAEVVELHVEGGCVQVGVTFDVPLGQFRLWAAAAEVNGGQLVISLDPHGNGVAGGAEGFGVSPDGAKRMRRDLAESGRTVFGTDRRPPDTSAMAHISNPWLRKEQPEPSIPVPPRLAELVDAHRPASGKYTKHSPALRPQPVSPGDQLVIRVDYGYLSDNDRGVLLVGPDATFYDLATFIPPAMFARYEPDHLVKFTIAGDRRPFQLTWDRRASLPKFDPKADGAASFTCRDINPELLVGVGDVEEFTLVADVLGDGHFALMIHDLGADDEFTLRVLAAGTFVEDLEQPVQWLASPPKEIRQYREHDMDHRLDILDDLTAAGQLAPIDGVWLDALKGRPTLVIAHEEAARRFADYDRPTITIDLTPPEGRMDPTATLTIAGLPIRVSSDALHVLLDAALNAVAVAPPNGSPTWACPLTGADRRRLRDGLAIGRAVSLTIDGPTPL